MNALENVPLWIAIPVALLLVLGSTLTLIGAFGFARLQSFYDRLHAPTLATSWGTGGIILSSALLASYLQGRVIVHELVIGMCIMVTIPVTLMLLGRASLYRDRAEGSPDLPETMRRSLNEEAERQAAEAEEREAREAEAEKAQEAAKAAAKAAAESSTDDKN